MSKHKQTRGDRKASESKTETTVVTASDVGSMSAVLGDSSTSTPAAASAPAESTTEQAPAEAAPVGDAVVAPENAPVGDSSMGEILGLALPKAPEKAAVKVGVKGEHTRGQADKLNFGMKETGDRLAKNKGISNGARQFKVGKGTGSAINTVWGYTLEVAKQVASRHEDGVFTAQELYDALFQTDWIAAGVTRVKYTPAQSVAYAGWINSLVKGAPSATFAIVVPVAADKAE